MKFYARSPFIERACVVVKMQEALIFHQRRSTVSELTQAEKMWRFVVVMAKCYAKLSNKMPH